MCHGSHVIRSWSTNQAVIALSSGEAEYYALVKGASTGIGLTSLLQDLGIGGRKIRLMTDSSAAVGICNRLGTGKVRHIEVNQLWIQEKVAHGLISVHKVDGKTNRADALTKPVSAEELRAHTDMLGIQIRSDRHPLAPELEKDDIPTMELEDLDEGEGPVGGG